MYQSRCWIWTLVFFFLKASKDFAQCVNTSLVDWINFMYVFRATFTLFTKKIKVDYVLKPMLQVNVEIVFKAFYLRSGNLQARLYIQCIQALQRLFYFQENNRQRQHIIHACLRWCVLLFFVLAYGEMCRFLLFFVRWRFVFRASFTRLKCNLIIYYVSKPMLDSIFFFFLKRPIILGTV